MFFFESKLNDRTVFFGNNQPSVFTDTKVNIGQMQTKKQPYKYEQPSKIVICLLNMEENI